MTDGLVGRTGRVVVRVRGGDVPGEVVLNVHGLPETYLAYSTDELPIGSHVLVIGTRGGRRIDVEPWSFADV